MSEAPGPHESQRLWDALLSGGFDSAHWISGAWRCGPEWVMVSKGIRPLSASLGKARPVFVRALGNAHAET